MKSRLLSDDILPLKPQSEQVIRLSMESSRRQRPQTFVKGCWRIARDDEDATDSTRTGTRGWDVIKDGRKLTCGEDTTGTGSRRGKMSFLTVVFVALFTFFFVDEGEGVSLLMPFFRGLDDDEDVFVLFCFVLLPFLEAGVIWIGDSFCFLFFIVDANVVVDDDGEDFLIGVTSTEMDDKSTLYFWANWRAFFRLAIKATIAAPGPFSR